MDFYLHTMKAKKRTLEIPGKLFNSIKNKLAALDKKLNSEVKNDEKINFIKDQNHLLKNILTNK